MGALSGFLSQIKAVTNTFKGTDYTTQASGMTASRFDQDKAGQDTAPRWLATVTASTALDALPWTDVPTEALRKRILKITGHSLTAGEVMVFSSGPNIYHEMQIDRVLDADHVMLAGELPVTPAGSETFKTCKYVTPTVDLSGNINIIEGSTSIVDVLDAGSLVPTGGSLIPRSSNNALQVVAALAARVTKIQSVSDVGEFMNLYLDAARTQLIGHVPLTPDEMMDVDIPAGSTIFLGASKDADIDDAGSIIQFNFIG